MRKYSLILFSIFLAIILLATACEVDSTIPLYKYRQDNKDNKGDTALENKYFIGISDTDMEWIFCDYPSLSEENQYLGIKPLKSYSVDVSIYNDKIKNTIDYILRQYYFYNYSYSKPEYQNNNDMVNQELKKSINSNDYFSSMQKKAIENKVDIDISELIIFNNIDAYTDKDNNTILRVACIFRLTVDAKDTENLTEYFTQLYPGNMNIVDAAFYFSINKDDVSLLGWREASADPLTVKWFTPKGIDINKKSEVILFEVENDRFSLYEGKTLIDKRRLDTDTYVKMNRFLYEFADNLFSFEKEDYWEKLDEHFVGYDNEKPDSEKPMLKNSFSSKLMGYREEPADITRVYEDNSGEYYEVVLHIAYEIYSKTKVNKDKFIEIKNMRIPIGSYTATIKALVSLNGEKMAIKDWALINIINKTKGLVMSNTQE